MRKKISGLARYKFDVSNKLYHNGLIDLELQNAIRSISKKHELISYLKKTLDSEQKKCLKKYKIPPFYGGETRTKIIYTPMGNKK